MAISKTIDFKGVVVENAYIKVEGLSGNKEKIVFYLNAYKDVIASENKENALNSHMIEFVPSKDEESLRWDKQAYEYAKTLPEYTEAIDV